MVRARDFCVSRTTRVCDDAPPAVPRGGLGPLRAMPSLPQECDARGAHGRDLSEGC